MPIIRSLRLYYSLKLLMMGIKVPETCWANYKFNKQLCSILLLFLSSYHRRCTDKHTSSSPDLIFVISFKNWHLEHLRDLYLGTGLPLTRHFQYDAAITTLASLQKVIHSFIHSAVCLTTGPKPLPKRALHIVQSKVSSFKWVNPLHSLRSSSSFLRLLPRLLVTIKLYYHQNIVLLKAKIYLRTPLRNIGKSKYRSHIRTVGTR
jgi:hypothetical protein